MAKKMTCQLLYGSKEQCTGCFACASICPVGAIQAHADDEGFTYPVIDTELCIACHKCVAACQIHGMAHWKTLNAPELFAVKNRNEEVRRQSSSGGVFSLLAEQVLSERGVVCGAVVLDSGKIAHRLASNREEYEKMRGSKYVQSDLGDMYVQCKKHLDAGRLVLFTGTPCQVAGIKNFLGQERDNLLTVDLLCRGICSPKIYNEWLCSLAPRVDKKTVSFRDKALGWNRFRTCFLTHNNKVYANAKTRIYDSLFFSHLILRQACYNCNFTNKQRSGDISLGDFWGIDRLLPDFDDDAGVSCVFLNSSKGKSYFQKIITLCDYRNFDVDIYVPYQPSLHKRVAVPPDRERFWADYFKYGFKKAIPKHVGKDIYHRGIRYIKRRMRILER